MDPVHDTRDCFRALVDAMSRPGTVQEQPTTPADHAVLATLVDHEVTCHTHDERLRTALENEGRFTEAEPEAADIVHTTGRSEGALESYTRGSLKEPSDGATVVYRVAGLSTDPPDGAGWTTLRLSGPGVPGERTLAVDGLPAAEASELAAAQAAYPRGVDAVLATESRIAAVPRSVDMEVV